MFLDIHLSCKNTLLFRRERPIPSPVRAESKGMSTSDDPILPKVYITQYALTKGVMTLENVTHCISISDRMISNRKGFRTCYHKPHWHLTKEEAISQVKIMVEKKKKSIQKTLAKLDKLEVKFS